MDGILHIFKNSEIASDAGSFGGFIVWNSFKISINGCLQSFENENWADTDDNLFILTQALVHFNSHLKVQPPNFYDVMFTTQMMKNIQKHPECVAETVNQSIFKIESFS